MDGYDDSHMTWTGAVIDTALFLCLADVSDSTCEFEPFAIFYGCPFDMRFLERLNEKNERRILMGTIILIIALVIEAAFATYCIVTKSNQNKRHQKRPDGAS